ncbi:MAG: phosphate ABC transporter permease subunit PstC [Pseudomonadota bacterium]
MNGAILVLGLAALSALIAGVRALARRRLASAGGELEMLSDRRGTRFAGRYAGFAALIAALGAGAVVSAVSAGALQPLVAALLAASFAGGWALFSIGPGVDLRRRYEVLVISVLGFIAGIAVLTTLGIFATLIFETLQFFQKSSALDFFFGTEWSPQTAIRKDQVASEGAFGVAPLIAGTLLVSLIAMAVAGPVGVMSAVFINTYANARARTVMKLTLELLAGVPTVVYGFFALLFVGPFVRDGAAAIGALFGAEIDAPAQNALAAGLVTGVMIIPFVSSLSEDVMSAIPRTLPEGAAALGATKAETVLKVVLPAAAPGLIGAFLLAVSRAVGETMIVVMAASRSANLTFDPLERVTTITVQIVALLTGDQEFTSAKTLAAFALGLTLFLITLALNVIALLSVKRFRIRYE